MPEAQSFPDIPADQLGKGAAPAAVLDITAPPPPDEDEPAKPAIVRTHERDEKTGRFKTVDKPAEPQQSAATVSRETPEAVEPTGGDKKPVEVADTDRKSEDEPSPAQRAAFARIQAKVDAQAAEIQRLAALIPKPEAPKPQPRPDPNAYDSPEAFDTALITWAEAEGARKALEKNEQERRQSEALARTRQVMDQWTARLETFKATKPDYDEKALASDLPVTAPMSNAIMAVENGPAVAYHLGEHRDEAARIAGLDALTATVEIGKLSAKLIAEATAPKPAPKPKPAPIVPVGERSAGDAKDPADMSTDEYAQWMQTRADKPLKYASRR